jgi:hypothetical protein
MGGWFRSLAAWNTAMRAAANSFKLRPTVSSRDSES